MCKHGQLVWRLKLKINYINQYKLTLMMMMNDDGNHILNEFSTEDTLDCPLFEKLLNQFTTLDVDNLQHAITINFQLFEFLITASSRCHLSFHCLDIYAKIIH